jgi:hypothetical protein
LNKFRRTIRRTSFVELSIEQVSSNYPSNKLCRANCRTSFVKLSFKRQFVVQCNLKGSYPIVHTYVLRMNELNPTKGLLCLNHLPYIPAHLTMYVHAKRIILAKLTPRESTVRLPVLSTYVRQHDLHCFWQACFMHICIFGKYFLCVHMCVCLNIFITMEKFSLILKTVYFLIGAWIGHLEVVSELQYVTKLINKNFNFI